MKAHGPAEIHTQKTPHLKLLLSAIVMLLAYLAVFWPTLAKMENIWRHSETYMHGYLILPISLWLIWRKKHSLFSITPEPTFLPIFFILPVLILWLMAFAIDVNFVSQFAAVFYLQLMLWSLLGHKLIKKIWFPISFLIFMVPFGDAANPVLQQITADLVVVLLHQIDMPVFRDGLYLYTASAVFEVAVACSGLNFLLSSLVLACLFCHLHFKKLYKSALFVVFVLVLSIAANGIRAFLLVVIGERTNLAYGFGADHYYYGWLVFFIVICFAFWVGGKFSDDTVQQAKVNPTDLQPGKNKIGNNTSLSPLLFALVIIPLAMAGWISKNMTTVEPPEVAMPRLSLPHAVKVENNDWGIQFFDGLSRDHWRLENGVEVFYAAYAHRQRKGDMITWHNRLYDNTSWSIITTETEGSLLNNIAISQLTNTNGIKKTLVHWYSLNDVNTSNRYVIKLLQLYDLLTGNKNEAKTFAILLPESVEYTNENLKPVIDNIKRLISEETNSVKSGI